MIRQKEVPNTTWDMEYYLFILIGYSEIIKGYGNFDLTDRGTEHQMGYGYAIIINAFKACGILNSHRDIKVHGKLIKRCVKMVRSHLQG